MFLTDILSFGGYYEKIIFFYDDSKYNDFFFRLCFG